MTTPLTIFRFNPRLRRVPHWLIASSVLLIAAAAPVEACEKSLGRIAAAPIEERGIATFTGEFVNGAPVYRLPGITVVTRRSSEVAKAPRNSSQPNAARSRTSATTPAPATNVATDSRESLAADRCVAKQT